MTKPCSVPNCPRPHYAKGWCSPHYKRVLKHGDPLPSEPLGRYGPEAVARGADKIRGRKLGPMKPEHREAIRAAKKGRSNGREGMHVSAETRAKISAANSRAGNANWKGDDVGYVALHERARKVIGKACEHCGETQKLDAALRRDAGGPMKVAHVNGSDVRYSTDTADYVALCRPCHKKYDTTG